jgi:hypothetical protein
MWREQAFMVEELIATCIAPVSHWGQWADGHLATLKQSRVATESVACILKFTVANDDIGPEGVNTNHGDRD